MPDRRPVVVLVEIQAKPRHEEDVRREATAVFGRIRAEESACTYIVGHQDVADPTRFMFFEEWRDDREFAEFRENRDYLREYFARLDEHIERRDFTRWVRFA